MLSRVRIPTLPPSFLIKTLIFRGFFVPVCFWSPIWSPIINVAFTGLLRIVMDVLFSWGLMTHVRKGRFLKVSVGVLGFCRQLSTRRMHIGVASRPIADTRGSHKCWRRSGSWSHSYGNRFAAMRPELLNTKPWIDACHHTVAIAL